MTSPKTSPNAKTKVRDIREESRSPKKASDSPTESTCSKSSKASTSSTHSSLDAPEGQQRLILRANFALPLGAEFCRFFPEWDVLKLMKQTGVLDWKPMEKFLRGLWVTTNYLKKPQKLKIRGLGRLQKREEDEKSEPRFNKNGNDKYMSVPGNANTLEFESKSGRISVAKYFKQRRFFTLRSDSTSLRCAQSTESNWSIPKLGSLTAVSLEVQVNGLQTTDAVSQVLDASLPSSLQNWLALSVAKHMEKLSTSFTKPQTLRVLKVKLKTRRRRETRRSF